MPTFHFESWKIVPSLPTVMVSSEGRVMVAPYQIEMPSGARAQKVASLISGRGTSRKGATFLSTNAKHTGWRS